MRLTVSHWGGTAGCQVSSAALTQPVGVFCFIQESHWGQLITLSHTKPHWHLHEFRESVCKLWSCCDTEHLLLLLWFYIWRCCEWKPTYSVDLDHFWIERGSIMVLIIAVWLHSVYQFVEFNRKWIGDIISVIIGCLQRLTFERNIKRSWVLDW